MKAPRWIGAVAILIISAAFSSAEAAEAAGKVILVIADRLTMEDLRQAAAPHIDALLQEGALGLVAPSALGRKTPEAVFASVGSGMFFKGYLDLNEAYSAGETVPDEDAAAAEVYARRMGRPAEGAVLLISTGKILRAIEERRLRLRPGFLGEVLKRNGLKTAVFGNSDGFQAKRRLAACIAMDETGQVPFGDVSGAMLRAGTGPTGQITDIEKMAKSALAVLPRASFVVLDFGDTARIDTARPTITDRAYESYKRAALMRLDALVARLLPPVRRGDAVLMIASFVPPGAEHWFHLTPLIVYEKDLPQGLLTSATTRTPGLIAGVDIAPFVLKTIGIKVPYEIAGEPVHTIADGGRVERLARLGGIVSRNAAIQLPLVGAVCALGMIAIIAAVASAAFGMRPTGALRAVIRWSIVFGLGLPLTTLVLGRVGIFSPVSYTLLVIAAMTSLAWAILAASALTARRTGLGESGPSALPVILLAGLTAVVVIGDALTSGQLARYSAIPTFGYRYYGIGNEYLGFTIGCICVVALWLAGPRGDGKPTLVSAKARRAYLVVLAISTLAIGVPGFGTNAGEALTAVVTLGLLYFALARGGFQAKHFFGLLGAGAVVLIALAAVDLAANGRAASHIGRSMAAVQIEGPRYLTETAGRKIAMNLKQLETRQARLALFGAGLLAALWYVGAQSKLSERMRGMRLGYAPAVLAVVLGAGVEMAANDNGILAGFLLLAPLAAAIALSLICD